MQESEIITLVLGLAVAALLIPNYSQMKRFPGSRILLVAFLMMLSAWAATVLEGFFWSELFNIVEHFSYLLSTASFAAWLFFMVRRRGRAER